MTKRCNETCMTDGRCTCAPRRVVTEGLDANGKPFVAIEGAPVHARHELVEDGAGRLSLSIIPADWDPAAHAKHCAEYLAERSPVTAPAVARWPVAMDARPRDHSGYHAGYAVETSSANGDITLRHADGAVSVIVTGWPGGIGDEPVFGEPA